MLQESGMQVVEASRSERENNDVVDLKRLAMRFDLWSYGRLRHFINALNKLAAQA